MTSTPTTPNQEEESVEVMEDVSTILKNEIQSICTRLANLGEESLFLSAKVAEKETTKLGSDTGFLFMSKFNIVQQFYHFVEDVYTTKPKTSDSNHPGDSDQNQKPMDVTMETSKQIVENKLEGNPVVQQSENAPSCHGNPTNEKVSQMRSPENLSNSLTNSHFNDVNLKTAGYTQQLPAGQTSQLSDIQLSQQMNAAQQPPRAHGQVAQIQLNQPQQQQQQTSVGMTTSQHMSNIHFTQASSSQQIPPAPGTILHGNDQPSNDQMSHVTSGSRAVVPDSNGNLTRQIQTFHENINSEAQIPIQYVSNVPSYLPIGIGNAALPGVFVDQGNILPGQGFIPQYGITSNIPSSSVNTHVVSHAEMEKIDPTGIVNQALVQSGIHENLAQTQIEPGNHGNMEHAAGNQVSIDGTAAKLAIPEGLDILQSDDTSKYHFFLEALRYLNPELYPRTEFTELNQPRNEGGAMPYVEGEVLQYTDAHHLTLPNPNLPHNFSELPPQNNQHMLNSIGQPVLVENSQGQATPGGTKSAEGDAEREKKKTLKKKKKKKKDPNLVEKSSSDFKPAGIKSPEISSPPSKKPSKGKSYKCDICNQFVESFRDIALHKVMHGGRVPPKCSICNSRFTTKRGLKHHMQKHQKEHSAPYTCEVCEKVFTEKDELMLHQQEHGHIDSQNNAQFVRSEVSEYDAASYDGQIYNQAKLGQPVSHFSQSEQAVSSAVNVPVGNVMISSNDNVDNLALQTLVNQRLQQDHQQGSNFMSANSEMVCHDVDPSHQNAYSKSGQGVEHTQQLMYSSNEQNDEQHAIYSAINQNLVNVSQSGNVNSLPAKVTSTEDEISTGTEDNLETNSAVGILTKTGETLDLSKMDNASDIVVTDEDGTRGMCKICGEEITSFEQTIVHFTIHKEQQSINESKKKREKVKEKSKKQQTRHKKGRKYPCETCGQQFQHFNDLCLHRISHKGKSPEKCLVCEKGFTSKRGVRLHMELHKKDSKPYLCTICKIEISDVQEFIDHKKSHGGHQEDDTSSMVESVGYSESGRSSSNSVLMGQHCPDKVNNNQIHQNINMSQTTNEKGELLQTTNQMHQNLNNLSQSTNEKSEIHNTLNDIQTIIHHTISNNAQAGSYQSGYETALGSNSQVLQQAATSGYNNPNLPLNMDPLQIAQMNLFFQQLNEQVASNVPLNLQQDSLTMESQQHTNKTIQNEHQITSQINNPQVQNSNPPSGEKKEKISKIPKKKNGKYHCDECEKAFLLFHDLRLHKVTHRGKTPQLCTVCNKLFVSKKGLRDHMTLHKKQLQKSACDICEKEFTDLNQLLSHKLEHVQEARSKMSDNQEEDELVTKQMQENYDNQIVGEPKVANYDSRLGVAMTTAEVKGHTNVNMSSLQQEADFTGQIQNDGKMGIDGNTGCQNILAGGQQINTGSQNSYTGSQHGAVENQAVLTGSHQFQTGSQVLKVEGQQNPIGSQTDEATRGNLPTIQLNEQPMHGSNLENVSGGELNHGDKRLEDQQTETQQVFKEKDQLTNECLLKRNIKMEMCSNARKGGETGLVSTSQITPTNATEAQVPHIKYNDLSEEVIGKNDFRQGEGQGSKGQGDLNKSKETKLATELTCLIDHVSNDSTNDEHECPFCRERFSGPESLKQHLYIHIEDSDTAGDEQSDESIVKMDDTQETFNHKDEKSHMCDVCGETFSEMDAFDCHCKTHKPIKEYKCSVCCEIFQDLVLFKNHKKVKGHENRRYKCEICFKSFSKEENLKRHNIKMHKKVPCDGNLCDSVNSADSNSKSVFTCAICGKEFGNQYKFSEHLNFHEGTTSHKCQVCNKIFTRGSGLKDHMNLHAGRKPYRCDICGKRYADISNWRKHKTSHSNSTKPTPFKCSVCRERFSSWKQMKSHTELLHPDNLTFLRISNKPKLKNTKKVKQIKK